MRLRSSVHRLCHFTDDILSHILCFLPAKDAAKTSILSRRWRHLFIILPKPPFEEDNIAEHPEMVKLVDRWLSWLPLTEFRLKCRGLPEPPALVVTWINKLLANNVKVIDITHYRPSLTPIHLLLPMDIMLCSRSLEVLKIRGRSFIANLPESPSCPNLKVLHLSCLDIRNDSGNNIGFSDQGFPLLNDLSLSNGNQMDVSDVTTSLTISSTALRKLAINYPEEMLTSVTIDAPHLEHMMFQASLQEKINAVAVRKCKALESAYIRQFELEYHFLELLSSISNVRRLHLSSAGFETFPHLPHLPNLVHLELSDTGGDTAWSFLDRIPNLETFVYNRGKVERIWPSSENIPMCFVQSLRQVILRSLCWEDEMSSDEEYEEETPEEQYEEGFQHEIRATMNQLQNLEQLLPKIDNTDGDEDEDDEPKKKKMKEESDDDEEEMSDAKIDVAAYFLKHGAVLERVVVEHSQPMTEQFRQATMNRLQNSERLSQKCEIVFRRTKKVKTSERYY